MEATPTPSLKFDQIKHVLSKLFIIVERNWNNSRKTKPNIPYNKHFKIRINFLRKGVLRKITNTKTLYFLAHT